MELFLILCVAFCANLAPAFVSEAAGLKIFPVPLDGGLRLGGKPLFGKHKTVGGAMLMITGALGAGYLLLLADSSLNLNLPIGQISGYNPSPLFLFIGIGLGVMLGDLFGSFLKRRFGFLDGQQAYILDWGDWILGTLTAIFILCLDLPDAATILICATIFLLLQACADLSARKLGLRTRKIK